jgi:hypothetical protein
MGWNDELNKNVTPYDHMYYFLCFFTLYKTYAYYICVAPPQHSTVF